MKGVQSEVLQCSEDSLPQSKAQYADVPGAEYANVLGAQNANVPGVKYANVPGMCRHYRTAAGFFDHPLIISDLHGAPT